MERARTVKPQEKANKSFVTDLDHDLERLIRDRLATRFPDDVLTGEEYASAGGTGPRRWSIDPIDGTGNLVHALPLWAVSVGLIDDGIPALGVIAIPPLNEMFWAVRGQGAFRDGEKLSPSTPMDFTIKTTFASAQTRWGARSEVAPRPAARPRECLLRNHIYRVQSSASVYVSRRGDP